MKKTYLNTLTPEEIIKRLKDGEFIRREDKENKYFYRMIDGVIVLIDDEDIIIGGSLSIDIADDYYFEEEKPFEITETGVYKTRDGQKVYVYKIEDDSEFLYPVRCVAAKLELSVNKFGRYSLMNETECDIVSEWKD